MADGFTATVDTSRFNWQMEKLTAALPKEIAPQVLRYQAKAFVSTMMKFPPIYNRAGKRIEKSLTQAVTPLTKRKVWSLLANSPRLRKRLEQLGITPDSSAKISVHALQVLTAPGGIFDRTPRLSEWMPIPGSELKVHIASKQDRYGKVSHRQPFYTPDVVAFNALLRRELKARGLLKAGWAAAAQYLGVPMPAAIASQKRMGGYLDNSTATASTATFSINNDAIKLPDYERDVNRALALRTKAMATQTRALLMGKAVNLGFATVGGESWSGNLDELSPASAWESGVSGAPGDFELLT